MSKKSPLTENKKEFFCEICDYITCNKKDYKKHENTNKHKRNVTQNVTILPNTEMQTFSCTTCSDCFRNRMSLHRHKKKCCVVDKQYDKPTAKPDENISIELCY